MWCAIPDVTGFAGSATKPVPLSDSEVEYILKSQGLDQKPKQDIDVEVGETVRITSGAFENILGVIDEINHEKGTLKHGGSVQYESSVRGKFSR